MLLFLICYLWQKNPYQENHHIGGWTIKRCDPEPELPWLPKAPLKPAATHSKGACLDLVLRLPVVLTKSPPLPRRLCRRERTWGWLCWKATRQMNVKVSHLCQVPCRWAPAKVFMARYFNRHYYENVVWLIATKRNTTVSWANKKIRIDPPKKKAFFLIRNESLLKCKLFLTVGPSAQSWTCESSCFELSIKTAQSGDASLVNYFRFMRSALESSPDFGFHKGKAYELAESTPPKCKVIATQPIMHYSPQTCSIT